MVESIFSMLDMQKDKNIPLQTRKNCVTVLGADPALSGKIKYNTLSNRKNVEGALPWNREESLREWTEVDTEYLLYYMETYYLISSDKKIMSALEIIADVHKFNPFIDMLNSVTWDGAPRIENLLTDYLGVKKTHYSIECMRLLMLGAISRAFSPGTKFDYVIVVSGAQGIGKSTFFRKLICNEEWYLENLKDVSRGKDSGELLQGKIIVEFNELLAFRGSVENIKSFVTLTADEYRGAYARESTKKPRTCVFVGTTNDSQFLVDKTGNRRFLPLECGIEPITKSLFIDDDILRYEFAQAWAEAYEIYKSGKFTLTVSKDLIEYVEAVQEDFKEDDPLVGMIQKWLDCHDDDYTCSIQIASEALKDENPDRKRINQINRIMNNDVTGWIKGTTHRFRDYGKQRCYQRERDENGFVDLEQNESYRERLPFQ